jgi:hypothetical protein
MCTVHGKPIGCVSEMRNVLFFLFLIMLSSCQDEYPISPQSYDASLFVRDSSSLDALPVSIDVSVPRDMSLPECPPSASGLFLEWLPCYAGCSLSGRQGVWCDKGVVAYGACEPCVEEACNGQDDDCDDIMDEGVYPCDTACGTGIALCAEGLLLGCTAPPVLAELCNDYDDDCDGEVDEGVVQACYTGNIAHVGIGECTPGQQLCRDGTWGNLVGGDWIDGACVGEVHAIEEVCDGADNDCDGIVDFGSRIRKTDILFVVDWSNSMGAKVEATLSALERFSLQFAATEEVWWGLVIGPVRVVNAEERTNIEFLKLVSNVAPFHEFLNRFLLTEREFIGGLEMLLDAVYISLRNISPILENDLAESRWVPGIESVPVLDEFVISWRPDSDRIIVVFTDETDRTYMIPPNTRHVLNPALQATPNLKMYTFAQAFYGWDELAIASGGLNFDLSTDSAEMYEGLMTILSGACQ